MIKIAVVDDQNLIVNGLRMMIEAQEDMEVVWTAGNGLEAQTKVGVCQPDIILMDIRMPEANGVEATKHILESHPEVKILVLTTFNEDAYIFDTLKAGASGYLLKDSPPSELMDSIRKVIKGGIVIEPVVATKVVHQINAADIGQGREIIEKLTARELEIAKMISQGMSNREISDAIFLSEGTVKNHLTSILEKLNLRDRTQLAIIMLKSHLN